MGIDQCEEHAAPIGRELEAADDLVREPRAGLLVVALVRSLSGIVQKQGEI